MGKAPLVLLRDVPGFIWNRLQFAVLRECLHMLEEGVAERRRIDAAVADGLAPRWIAAGPLARRAGRAGHLPTVGRDCSHLAEATSVAGCPGGSAAGLYRPGPTRRARRSRRCGEALGEGARPRAAAGAQRVTPCRRTLDLFRSLRSSSGRRRPGPRDTRR